MSWWGKDQKKKKTRAQIANVKSLMKSHLKKKIARHTSGVVEIEYFSIFQFSFLDLVQFFLDFHFETFFFTHE